METPPKSTLNIAVDFASQEVWEGFKLPNPALHFHETKSYKTPTAPALKPSLTPPLDIAGLRNSTVLELRRFRGDIDGGWAAADWPGLIGVLSVALDGKKS